MLRHPLARSDNISKVTAAVGGCCSRNTEKSNHSFPVVSSLWKTKQNKRLLWTYRRQEWSESVTAFNHNFGGKRWRIYGVIISHLNVSVRASNEWMLCANRLFFSAAGGGRQACLKRGIEGGKTRQIGSTALILTLLSFWKAKVLSVLGDKSQRNEDRQSRAEWLYYYYFFFKLLTPLADSLLERDCSKEPLLDVSMINPQHLRLSLTHEAPFGVTNAHARTCMRTRAHSQLVRIRTGF